MFFFFENRERQHFPNFANPLQTKCFCFYLLMPIGKDYRSLTLQTPSVHRPHKIAALQPYQLNPSYHTLHQHSLRLHLSLTLLSFHLRTVTKRRRYHPIKREYIILLQTREERLLLPRQNEQHRLEKSERKGDLS